MSGAAEAGQPRPPLDLTECLIKPDQFDGCHVLDERFEKLPGAPNWRQVAPHYIQT